MCKEVLPKIDIQTMVAHVGAITTPIKNSLMVRPLDIRATNNPTKGAQANHHPQ